MRTLASSVGIRESALYVHFRNKQHILQCLMETFGPAREIPAFTHLNISAHQSRLKESLLELAEDMIDHWCEPEAVQFYRLMMSECLRGTSAFREESRELLDQLRTQIRHFLIKISENSRPATFDIDFVEAEFIGPMMFMRQEVLLMNDVSEPRELLKSFAKKHIEFMFTNLLRSTP
ncbi:MAG: hypothetical protein RLZZ488_1112 [Pseudomonadota bacterium]